MYSVFTEDLGLQIENTRKKGICLFFLMWVFIKYILIQWYLVSFWVILLYILFHKCIRNIRYFKALGLSRAL